jgi:hypothetical protein
MYTIYDSKSMAPLDELLALDPEALRAELLAPNASELAAQLQHVQQLALLLPLVDDTELQQRIGDVVRVAKALSRVAVKYVAAVAADRANVAAQVQLDDSLLPILRLLQALVDLVRTGERRQSEKDLRKWLPFVVTLCCFLEGAGLPGAELMQSVVLAEGLLDGCVELVGAEDRQTLMAKYVAQIVALCSQDVAKDEWVAPQSLNKQVMLQVVEQVPFPHLGGDLLGRLLALTFPLVDDLTDSTQLIGARLLVHIVRNVTPTELRWYSDVLLEVLHTAIVSRKPATLDLLLGCLVESLDKVSPPGELKHYDRFMLRLLNDTSLCSDVAIRLVFVRHLRTLVVRQGAPHSLNVIRYLQPLLKVLIAGFESINVTLLVETLGALRSTVLAAWPRIAPHTERILVGVLRAVAFCELFDEGADFTPTPKETEQLLALCEDVLDLLDQVNGANPAVSDMLATAGGQCPQLLPFCDRMRAKLATR